MRINVDAGHGSNTAGKRTPPLPVEIDINQDGVSDIKKGEQYWEHYANVGVASLLVKELQRCGFDTLQTGFNDNNAAEMIRILLWLTGKGQLQKRIVITVFPCISMLMAMVQPLTAPRAWESISMINMPVSPKNWPRLYLNT